METILTNLTNLEGGGVSRKGKEGEASLKRRKYGEGGVLGIGRVV